MGPKKDNRLPNGQETFTALISASTKDADHPRKTVVRALIHRGAKVIATKGRNFCTSINAPIRAGWGPIAPVEYPDESEE